MPQRGRTEMWHGSGKRYIQPGNESTEGGIGALFLGVGFLDNLDPERADPAGLLATLEADAVAVQGLLGPN